MSAETRLVSHLLDPAWGATGTRRREGPRAPSLAVAVAQRHFPGVISVTGKGQWCDSRETL